MANFQSVVMREAVHAFEMDDALFLIDAQHVLHVDFIWRTTIDRKLGDLAVRLVAINSESELEPAGPEKLAFVIGLAKNIVVVGNSDIARPY